MLSLIFLSRDYVEESFLRNAKLPVICRNCFEVHIKLAQVASGFGKDEGPEDEPPSFA